VFTKNRRRLLEAWRRPAVLRWGGSASGWIGAAKRRAFHRRWHADRSRGQSQGFRRKDRPPQSSPPDDPGNPTVDFHGEKRANATH